MTKHLSLVCAAALSVSLVAGCNSPAPPPLVAPGPGSRAVTPPEVKLPEGAGCTGVIARYRAIQDNDLAMGHVNQGVYNQIQSEIAAAEKACAAGEDAKAQGLIRASKSRHGYPA
jgi:hypothetical protein